MTPRLDKGNEAIFAAEQLLNRGEFQAALDGDENTTGFLTVIDKYGATKAGQRAKYDAGICYLRLEQYDMAKKYLKSYKGKDALTPILAEMCLGDAEIGLGNQQAALKHYNKAAKMDDNYLTAPMALFKAGLVYIDLKDKENAAKCFQSVKDNYPESSLYSEMDRYIAYAENME
ncbi:MAG: tetratricopeptide repeat protein [Bacteroidales bacterium]|nr:tetratricopeptide repeat protein [Bacteroidales bacterium]